MVMPVPLPPALLAPVLGAGIFLTLVILMLFLNAWNAPKRIHVIALNFLRPWEPILDWAGISIPQDGLDKFGFMNALVTFYIALGCSALQSAWLLVTVIQGYKRMFRQMAQGHAWHGKEVYTHSPTSFHAQWATYFAGALMGNAILGVVFILFPLWIILFMLSLGEFWSLMWSLRSYLAFYALLYITRYCVFNFVVPQYVVTDEGLVLRPLVWSILFPSLTLLNFIQGALSGLIRFGVMFPYLLLQYVRVDMTFLPGEFSNWDFSFQPFVSLVLQAHRQLNPVLIAAAATFDPSLSCDEVSGSSRNRETEQGSHREVEASASGPLKRVRNRWRLAVTLAENPSLQKFRCPQPPVPLASSSRSGISLSQCGEPV